MTKSVKTYKKQEAGSNLGNTRFRIASGYAIAMTPSIDIDTTKKGVHEDAFLFV